MFDALPYRYIVAADSEFEFGGHASFEEANRSGERQRPVCVAAKELRSGQEWRLFRGEFDSAPPFPVGPDALFVAYYASAELGGFKALSWQKPTNILDLFTEFRNRTNGLTTPAGAGLVGALTYFGLNAIATEEKDQLRLLILRGGPWSESERKEILDYCATDVDALERLLPAMLPRIDLPRALLRGRYMAASAAMEFYGVPIDTATLSLLREHWTDIQDDLIHAIDVYGIYDGRTFKAERWANLLNRNNIPWPLLESGNLDLGDNTFRQMAKSHPLVSPYRELRSALSDLRLNDLAVGHDARNRTVLSAFRARSGRNAPSNTRFIFGPSVWLRGLIKPPPRYGVAYVDWSQQEFGIAAALSNDVAMQEAYRSGDPYLTFGKQAGAIPHDATKNSHKSQRELFKACVLGVQYGMEAESLALRIGQPPIVARGLLRAHHETYPTFWRWSDAAVDYAMLYNSLHTVFGWYVHIGENPNPRSLRNHPMQANGAEMLRLACCLGIERGIEICAPVHDAVPICAPLDRLDDDIAKMREVMAEASRIVLSGFELRTDVNIVKYPDRYMDDRGTVMWDRVMRLIANRQSMKVNGEVA
ncbi:MAG: DNA polymerase [Xanthobacteraceae bacterium]